MKNIKVCFVGIGSIARRHVLNLNTICKKEGIHLKIDALRRKKTTYRTEVDDFIQNIYTDFRNLPDDYDIIFITNPTSMHMDTLREVHEKAKHFFY